jgi:hypothetical protein
MSYRITAHDYELGEEYDGKGKISHQIYGNNCFPIKLRDYLVSQKVAFDSDDCFKDYDVTDLQGLLDVMLEIHKEEVEDDSYWDFKPGVRYHTDTVDGLISYLNYRLDVAIVLVMYNFYKAFEGSIESYWDDQSNGAKYKIKDGMKIYLSGF